VTLKSLSAWLTDTPIKPARKTEKITIQKRVRSIFNIFSNPLMHLVAEARFELATFGL
jgi:hypothetical protein